MARLETKRRFGGLVKLAVGTLLAGCANDPQAEPTPVPVVQAEVQGQTTAGQPVQVRLSVRRGSLAVANSSVQMSVLRGGGSVPASVLTDSAGVAMVAWLLGPSAVPQRLHAVLAAEPSAQTDLDLTPAAGLVLAAKPFGDVDAYLTAQKNDGSTEDLAFAPDGRLVMGVPGGLVSVDVQGKTSAIPLTGDPLEGPLGLAYDPDGVLWVADAKAHALRKVSPAGKVTTVTTQDGADALVQPNDVAVAGPVLYLTDTCLGRVMRVDRATGQVTARFQFDIKADGSPNGVALGPDGALWLTTENSGLLCPPAGVPPTAPLAGLYRLALTADGFGERTTLATGLGLFGDGLAFDAEGNLYALYDTVKGFELDETQLWVLPAGGTKLTKLFAAKERVWANIAFGRAAFGQQTAYLSLLKVAPFTPDTARGLERVELGIAGKLLP